MSPLTIHLGVKSDPIEYRYSFAWLFRLMAEENVHRLQFGSFFEAYQLEDAWFRRLRDQAADHGITIESLFTAHRELGGFFQNDPAFERVARKNYERFIEIGALLGARRVGSNPGATLRDQIVAKHLGLRCYTQNMKALMLCAKKHGLDALTIEPMSCVAEPPTFPREIATLAEELLEYHRATPDAVPIGYCADTSHGYANEHGDIIYNHLALFIATLPYLIEVHVKNTDHLFQSTFGFGEEERARGIVNLAEIRALLDASRHRLPTNELTAFLEISGPKLGRDYTDCLLEDQLRQSLRHMRETLLAPEKVPA